MQGWIVAVCWVAVVVFAAIVLGFLSYEVSWKARRLAGDRAKLAVLVEDLATVGRTGKEG